MDFYSYIYSYDLSASSLCHPQFIVVTVKDSLTSHHALNQMQMVLFLVKLSVTLARLEQLSICTIKKKVHHTRHCSSIHSHNLLFPAPAKKKKRIHKNK